MRGGEERGGGRGGGRRGRKPGGEKERKGRV